MKYINIKNIIKKSNSKLLKSIPNFGIKIIGKIIKQDEINEILSEFKEYEGIPFLEKVIEKLNINVEIEGIENLSNNQRAFFVANHPFGILDGLIITNIVGKKYGVLKAIGNDAFMHIPQLKHLIVNVSVFDKSPRKYYIELNKIYASNIPITHFPAGFVSRISKGKIRDKQWEKSFIKKAISNQRNVVPILFYGKNSNLFYTIFLLRKILHIKTNIELILLPRELFRKQNKTIKVKIMKPISYKSFDNSISHLEWAKKIKNQVYNNH